MILFKIIRNILYNIKRKDIDLSQYDEIPLDTVPINKDEGDIGE